jgi:serine/threonine-protein kinase
MSPEQAAGRTDEVGPRSDVYGIGAILYELLTGRPPFSESTPLDTLVQVLEGEPRAPRHLNPKVPAELEAICLHCLEKNSIDRYPSSAALAADLARFSKNEALDLRTPSLRQRLRRWWRREPSLVAHLVTLGTCMAIVQAGSYVHVVALSLHLSVLGILAAWMVVSVLCQRLLRTERFADFARFGWAAADVVCFSAIVYRDDALLSPVLIGFPLLIVGSGLWVRARLVWFTAAIAELAYAALLAEWMTNHDVLRGLHKHLMFMVGLAVTAWVVAYQVNRVRTLSRYYENRPLP